MHEVVYHLWEHTSIHFWSPWSCTGIYISMVVKTLSVKVYAVFKIIFTREIDALRCSHIMPIMNYRNTNIKYTDQKWVKMGKPGIFWVPNGQNDPRIPTSTANGRWGPSKNGLKWPFVGPQINPQIPTASTLTKNKKNEKNWKMANIAIFGSPVSEFG